MKTGWKLVRSGELASRRLVFKPALAHTRPSDTKLQQLWLPVNVLSHSVPIQKTPYAMDESNVFSLG